MTSQAQRKACIVALTIVLAALVLRERRGVVPSEELIPLDGVAVLIVEETEDRGSLPAEQYAAVLGKTWQELLPPGNWRVLDQDAKFTGDSPFKAAFERPRDSVPWLVVSGKQNYEGPLPGTGEEIAQKIEAAR